MMDQLQTFEIYITPHKVSLLILIQQYVADEWPVVVMHKLLSVITKELKVYSRCPYDRCNHRDRTILPKNLCEHSSRI